jgi:excisionase family DNA binding protein
MTTPYTPETLAKRWGVSAQKVRNMCAAGEVAHFRLGKLYRIPAVAVEEYEQCQILASGVSGADFASIGMTPQENVSAISLRHSPERKRRGKP